MDNGRTHKKKIAEVFFLYFQNKKMNKRLRNDEEKELEEVIRISSPEIFESWTKIKELWIEKMNVIEERMKFFEAQVQKKKKPLHMIFYTIATEYVCGTYTGEQDHEDLTGAIHDFFNLDGGDFIRSFMQMIYGEKKEADMDPLHVEVLKKEFGDMAFSEEFNKQWYFRSVEELPDEYAKHIGFVVEH